MIKPEVFRQYDIRGIVGEDIDEESFYLIGKGFGTYLHQKGLSSLVLGGDARYNHPSLKEAFARELWKQPALLLI
jgi:phosphomannomutase/phosphoglucomutase